MFRCLPVAAFELRQRRPILKSETGTARARSQNQIAQEVRRQEEASSGSTLITTLMAGVGLTALAIWEWFQKNPVVDVRLFKSSNFAASNVMFLSQEPSSSPPECMPRFLQTTMGYTAQTAGLVLSSGALVILLTMPLVGQITSRFHAIRSHWLDCR